MDKKSNLITNIVVVLFILVGFAGMTLISSKYSDVIEKDSAAKNYLQQGAICMREMETDICIAINVGRNLKNSDDTLEIDEYIEKINDSLTKNDEIIAKYESLKKSADEENGYRNVKITMAQYTEIIRNEILPQIKDKYYESANSIYFDRFIGTRNKLDSYVNDLLDITEQSIDDNYSNTVIKIRLMQLFFVLAGVVLFVIVNLIEKGRRKMAKNLESAIDKNEKAMASLNSAVFNDAITNINNRFSFVVDYCSGKTVLEKNDSYYFVMLNINDFSDVIINMGNDTGDKLLNLTVERIKGKCGDAPVYRTGSDQFIIVFKEVNDNTSFERIMAKAGEIYDSLAKPYDINGINVKANHSFAIVRKSGPAVIDTTIISALEKTLKEGKTNPSGKLNYSSIV